MYFVIFPPIGVSILIQWIWAILFFYSVQGRIVSGIFQFSIYFFALLMNIYFGVSRIVFYCPLLLCTPFFHFPRMYVYIVFVTLFFSQVSLLFSAGDWDIENWGWWMIICDRAQCFLSIEVKIVRFWSLSMSSKVIFTFDFFLVFEN